MLRGQAWSWDQGHLSHTAGPEFIDEGAGCSPPHTPVFGTRSTPTSQHSALNPQDSGPLSALYLFIFSSLHGLWDLTSLTYGNPESKEISESEPLDSQGILSLH